jgi:hypothetical protein
MLRLCLSIVVESTVQLLSNTLLTLHYQVNVFERQAVCGDYTCSINTDCYAQRCGNCNGGRCGCPPEGC